MTIVSNKLIQHMFHLLCTFLFELCVNFAGQLFLQKAAGSRKRIAKLSGQFIRDGAVSFLVILDIFT